MKTNLSFLEVPESGLTRLDLVAAVAGVCLILALTLPVMGADRRASHLGTCFNNLRQIGQAYLMWGASHHGQRPFRAPAPEGTFNGFKTGNAWQEYFFMREELGTPRILACPADNRTQVTQEWRASDPTLPTFSRLRSGAVSYFVGLDADASSPRSTLSGDYHMTTDGISGCSSGVNNANRIRRDSVEWTNAVHGLAGHILFNDGSVEQLSSQGLRDAFNAVPDDNGVIHTLFNK